MQIDGPALDARDECERVLRSLPGWFGIESALLEYAQDSARLPTFALRDAGHVAGFVTLRRHFAHAWELHCIAVHRDHRHQGLGRVLLAHAQRWLVEQGATLLQVKTIAESHPGPEYAQTRAFYLRMGFVPVEVFPTLWSPRNPCLQMIKLIGRSGRGRR